MAFTYDANGNTIEKVAAGVTTRYDYNTEDRLEAVIENGATLIATYTYDPFGRRLWKEVGGVRTYFIYADEGLVAEADSSGAIVKTYGYKPGSTWTTDPLFMQESGQYYWYHNDHLGTPQKMTSVSGAVVWAAKYSSFGKADVDPGSTITSNLRFAGQYFDNETGLHYNWNRYYDPKIGRYLRPDPIGLSGMDPNLYGYVQNNPVNRFDPIGLLAYIKNEIDCLGYASGFGSYVEPEGRDPSHKNKQSLEQLVNELGYKCYSVSSSTECKCSDGEDKMIVYITRYGENPEKKDPWSDPWIFHKKNDYHAMKEDSPNSWSHVTGYYDKPYKDKIIRGLKKPEDYDSAKGKAYCCCKCK